MTASGFTFDRYRELLTTLKRDGRQFKTYDEPMGDGGVLLRHDVDLSPERALQMARIEADLDITSTYFVLCSTPMYNPRSERLRSVVQALEQLGHDVGLHFSTHQYWQADAPPAEAELTARVEEERALLDDVAADVAETVSFHVPPEWLLERTFEDIESTYEPRFFGDIDYVADSNQRWRDSPPVVDEFGAKVQLLVHPGLWGDDDATFDERVHQAESASIVEVTDYATRTHLVETKSD